MIRWKTRNDLDRAIVTLCDEQQLTANELERYIHNVSPGYLRRRLRALRKNEVISYDAASRTWRTQ